MWKQALLMSTARHCPDRVDCELGECCGYHIIELRASAEPFAPPIDLVLHSFALSTKKALSGPTEELTGTIKNLRGHLSGTFQELTERLGIHDEQVTQTLTTIEDLANDQNYQARSVEKAV